MMVVFLFSIILAPVNCYRCYFYTQIGLPCRPISAWQQVKATT
nr:MAG TPA: periplasmic lypoprotein [Caudoviricetes sp.]